VPKGLADLLKEFVSDRSPGLVFTNRLGKPLSQTNLFRRSLHPILAELGVKRAGRPPWHAAHQHSEGIRYKPPGGEIRMCLRVGRMRPIK
jgi:hypothetical protein